jgi:hypothetical protein
VGSTAAQLRILVPLMQPFHALSPLL